MGVHLGFDIGTSSVKVSAVEDNGTVLARASSPYSTVTGAAGEAEQDPVDWLAALRSALHECGDCVARAESVGIVGQTPTLVAVDADYEAVRPAMTWQDSRSTIEADELARELGDSEALLGTNLPWSPTQMPAKLLWLARHEQRTVARTRWLLQPKDFVGLRLTGKAGSDPWSSKGLCEVRGGAPAREILGACGWPVTSAPSTRAPWAARGFVSPSGAHDFGVPEGIPVAVGWSDALAAMLAVGVFDAPTAFILAGTSEIVGVSVVDAPGQAPGLYTVPSSCAPLELVYGPTQASGAAVEWIAALTGKSVKEALTGAATGARAASRTPTFVPYIDGERAPVWRSDVRGVFMGLGSDHRGPDLVRGVLAGVAMSARHVLTLASAATDCQLSPVHVGGREVSSEPWVSARLRSLGASLSFHDEPSLSALGAAMLGAAAAGRPLETTNMMREEPLTMTPTAEDIEGADQEFAAYLQASQSALEWTQR